MDVSIEGLACRRAVGSLASTWFLSGLLISLPPQLGNFHRQADRALAGPPRRIVRRRVHGNIVFLFQIFRSGIEIQAGSPEREWTCMVLPRGLRSIGVSRLPDYYSPLRLPHRPATRLLIPASPWNIRACSARMPPCGSPSFLDCCVCSLLHDQWWLRHLRKRAHSHVCNEAESSSLALRLTSSTSGASAQRLLV